MTSAEFARFLNSAVKEGAAFTGKLKVELFDSADFDMTTLFASQASLALLNAETYHAVATRAETDALTGLRNRRAFEEQIVSLLRDQGAQPVTLLMLDLDGFKGFNDHHGHPAGDDLLQGVATSLTDAVRGRDRVYRFGGDEFAVFLPTTSEAVGLHVAERVRAAVAGLDSGADARVTASIGMVSRPANAVQVSGPGSRSDLRTIPASGRCPWPPVLVRNLHPRWYAS